MKWILPNEWGSDTDHDFMNKNPLHVHKGAYRQHIADAGAKWIGVICGQWYDFCISFGGFGVYPLERRAEIHDDGNVKTVTTTLAQTGRAVAALFSVPVAGASPSLEDWANKFLYVESFHLSQNEMLAAGQRATGTKAADWTVERKGDPKAAVETALVEFGKGSFPAVREAIMVSNWVPNGGGDYKSTKGTANEALGLPKEDLDEETRKAVELAKKGDPMFH